MQIVHLEPIVFFLEHRTLNLGPFAAKIFKLWDLETQTFSLIIFDFQDLSLAINIKTRTTVILSIESNA
jgi:hypothetical protein